MRRTNLNTDFGELEPSPHIDEQIARLADQCFDVLSHKPSALATDIDGTISPIALTPESAFVAPEAIESLSDLARYLDLLFVLTGRTARDAERMINLPAMLYIGNHGLERRWHGKSSDDLKAIESIQAIRRALGEVDLLVRDQGIDDGLLIEDKQLTASIHYRLSPTRDRIGPILKTIVQAAALDHGLRMTEGRYVLELRPEIAVNKGTAALDVIQEHGLKGIVFLGDDVTDIDAFRAIRRLRENRLLQGLSIAVNSPETKSVVLEEADAVVDGVGSVVQLLSQLAVRFRNSSPPPEKL